jgi:hypothetical protein
VFGRHGPPSCACPQPLCRVWGCAQGAKGLCFVLGKPIVEHANDCREISSYPVSQKAI